MPHVTTSPNQKPMDFCPLTSVYPEELRRRNGEPERRFRLSLQWNPN
jgi:hypothetical protein